MPALLARRSPLGATEAARLAPHRLAAVDTQVAGLPVDGLRAGAYFADSPHTARLASKLAHAAPHEIFLFGGHRPESFGNLVFGQAFLPQQDSQIELGHGNELGPARSAELPGPTGGAPEAGQNRLGLLSAGDAEIAAFVVFRLPRGAVAAVHDIGAVDD